MAYVNDTLLQTLRDDNLVSVGYNTFKIAELLEHLRVLPIVWISLTSVVIAYLDEWNKLAELLVSLRCILNFNE